MEDLDDVGGVPTVFEAPSANSSTRETCSSSPTAARMAEVQAHALAPKGSVH